MKNIQIKLFLVIILFASLLVACSKDFLSPEAPGSILEINYYKNEAEAYTGLVAAMIF